ncbi:MAG: FAD-dependent oxidoreductase [Candidatus Saelkia tenebricola]|nr:FAD-dependent oxidoreductase [Candidatus Saelkia tenebricola]
MIKTDVLIIGAGISGLAAAHYLTQKGVKVIVLEKEPNAGGMCRTLHKDGFLFDLGGHRFLTKHVEILQLVKKIMGEDLVKRPRKSMVYWKERYFGYPLNMHDLNFNLRLTDKIGIFKSLMYEMTSRLVGREKDINLEQYLISKFGFYLYQSFFKQYNEKLWGISPSMMSSDWAVERIPNLDYKQIILNVFFKRLTSSKSLYDDFYYPQQGGIGQIAEEFKNIAEKKGAEFIFDTNILAIHHDKLKVLKIDCLQGNNKIIFCPKYIISTIPINKLIKVLNPPLGIDSLKVDEVLKYRSVKILNLMLRREKVTDYTWIYIPSKEIIFFRLQEPKNWHPNNTPTGYASISLEISCSKGDEIWSAEDSVILKSSLKGLKKIGLNISEKEIIDCFSSSIENAYPIYSLNYKQILSEAGDVLQRIENLSSTGRQGQFKYANMDEAIKMGIESAKSISEYV